MRLVDFIWDKSGVGIFEHWEVVFPDMANLATLVWTALTRKGYCMLIP